MIFMPHLLHALLTQANTQENFPDNHWSLEDFF